MDMKNYQHDPSVLRQSWKQIPAFVVIERSGGICEAVLELFQTGHAARLLPSESTPQSSNLEASHPSAVAAIYC